MALDSVVEQVASLARVKEAGVAAAELVELWPLTNAEQMDNDAKYVEDLQVRITSVLAEVMTGSPVRPADAEYVYEGADNIPGCDQRIVDALLNANDAYDTLDEYSETRNVDLLVHAAELLNADWDEHTIQAVRDRVAAVESYIDAQVAANGHYLTDSNTLTARFALVVVAVDTLLRAVIEQIGGVDSFTPEIGGADEQRNAAVAAKGLPLVLFANELAERLGVPRLYATKQQLHGLIAAYDTPNGDYSSADAAVVIAEVLAPMAMSEWHNHKQAVLWDSNKAKEEAKAEDERKNKEALAAKFAHVKDDPNKEEVEL